MPEDICPICSKGLIAECDDSFETTYVDRRGVRQALRIPNVKRLRCSSCGEEILHDEASKQIEEARRNAIGLLSCKEIRELRRRLGRTQAQMSALLGVGGKTYTRWESGAFVQSVAFDNYLRVIRDVPEAAAKLIHLEEIEPDGPSAMNDESDLEFAFIKNFGGVAESAAKFTLLMATGMLHVPFSTSVGS